MLFHKRGMLVPFTVINKEKHKKSLSGEPVRAFQGVFFTAIFIEATFKQEKVRCGFSL